MYHFFWFLLDNTTQAQLLTETNPSTQSRPPGKKQDVRNSVEWRALNDKPHPPHVKCWILHNSYCTTLSQSLSPNHWAPMAAGLPEASEAKATWVSQAEVWLECSWHAAELCNKPKVKARQTLGNFPGPQSRGGISWLYRKPGCMSSLVWPTAITTTVWPVSTGSSRGVSLVMLPTPKQVWQWSCAADTLLRRSSVPILFSKEPNQLLRWMHTLSDVLTPSWAT